MADSVWTRPRRGKEQPALTRAQIVAEAIRLLDADGLDTLSMRNLGTRLGAGATSLYRHVANKDELIELVVDEVYGELENPAAEGWRGSLTAAAHSVRAMILRHPWMASVLGQVGLSYLGPNVMRLNESLLAALETDGFTLEDADQAVSAVVSYVIGMSTAEAAWLTTLARSGRAEAEWIADLRPAALAAAESYPRLRALLERTDDTPDATREDNFTYGLNRLLDGLEHRP
jgi:AcrR family transcriptional regulator